MEKGQQNPGVILGRLVRAAREEKHMSVNALSRASSISPRTIRTIEGENPSGSKPLTVVCLATALEADLDSWTKELGISISSGVILEGSFISAKTASNFLPFLRASVPPGYH